MRSKIKDPKVHLKKNHLNQAVKAAKKLQWTRQLKNKIILSKVKTRLSKDKHQVINKIHANNLFSHLLK